MSTVNHRNFTMPSKILLAVTNHSQTSTRYVRSSFERLLRNCLGTPPKISENFLSYFSSTTYAFGPYLILGTGKRLLRGNETVRLTEKEFLLLFEMAKQEGQVASKDSLLASAWAESKITSDDYIYAYVARLNKKLGPDPAGGLYIRNASGAGYFIAGVKSVTGLSQIAKAILPWVALSTIWGLFAYSSSAGAFSVATVIAVLMMSLFGCLLVFRNLPWLALPRPVIGLTVLSMMAYIPSGATLGDALSGVVNAATLKLAFFYPFVTGLKFIPSLVLVMAFWIFLREDRQIDRGSAGWIAYVVFSVAWPLLTISSTIQNSSDWRIFALRIPGWDFIACGYAIILLVNVFVSYTCCKQLGASTKQRDKTIASILAIAYVIIAALGINIHNRYNFINRHYLDLRRPNIYATANASNVTSITLSASLRQEVGADLERLLDSPAFLKLLCTSKLYKQNYDENFLVRRKAVMYGFRSSPLSPASTPQFTVIRFPLELAAILGVRLVEEKESRAPL